MTRPSRTWQDIINRRNEEARIDVIARQRELSTHRLEGFFSADASAIVNGNGDDAAHVVPPGDHPWSEDRMESYARAIEFCVSAVNSHAAALDLAKAAEAHCYASRLPAPADAPTPAETRAGLHSALIAYLEALEESQS